MSTEPEVVDFQHGLVDMTETIDELVGFASNMDEAPLGRGDADERTILRFCAEINSQSCAVSKVLVIQSRCHEAAKELYAYPNYARQARYCIEISLQAAELGSMAQEFASRMAKEIKNLHDRADQRDLKKWSGSNEAQFWQGHSRLDHIAATYMSFPKVPDHGESTRPVEEVSKADQTLREYLRELERIPNHHRIIIDRLGKMSEEMVHKYYKDEPWYLEAARAW